MLGYRWASSCAAAVALGAFLVQVDWAAAEDTSASSAAALHSPQACDVSLTLEEIVKIHAPKASKRYKIAYSMISLAATSIRQPPMAPSKRPKTRALI